MIPRKAILRWGELISWLQQEGYSVRQVKRLKRLGFIHTYRFASRPNGQSRYITMQVYRSVVEKNLNVAKKRGRPRI